MVFSTPIFLFLYLPCFLLGYYLLVFPAGFIGNPSVRKTLVYTSNLFILIASLCFYFWGETWLVCVMLFSIVVDHACAQAVSRCHGGGRRKVFLLLSILANLSLLGFFKYFNFGLESFNTLAGALGLGALQIHGFAQIALPLGISFYTFQSMSYTIDVYRGEVTPTRNFFDFACFVSMFPQLVAGPIVRYRDIAEQLVDRKVDREHIVSGTLRFLIGLCKKVLIANTVAVPADKIFALPPEQLTSGLAWLGITCYALQIYFDFSGYSDMAIGLGRMMGFSFPENFAYPYSAQSIQDFWRRWHITLSSWFRDYVYIPLGGGRRHPVRVYANLLVVFLLCGLWHGASWTFVVWGGYHGLFLVIERLGWAGALERQWAPVRHLYVVMVVLGGWVLFRSDTFTQALMFYAALVGQGPGDGVLANVSMFLKTDVALALVLGGLFSGPVVPRVIAWKEMAVATIPPRAAALTHMVYSGVKVMLLLSLAVMALMGVSGGTYNPFIYFRF